MHISREENRFSTCQDLESVHWEGVVVLEVAIRDTLLLIPLFFIEAKILENMSKNLGCVECKAQNASSLNVTSPKDMLPNKLKFHVAECNLVMIKMVTMRSNF